jgi:hypothetical protein
VQQVAYPDFDMWEAYGDFAAYHSVLRALSGGPVYITGDVAQQDWGLVRRLILSDGTVLRTDAPIVPTRDSLFVDAGQLAVPLKGFARVGAAGLIGVWNAHEAGASVAGAVRAADVDGIEGGRFAILEHFSRRLREVGATDQIPVRLSANQAELYWVVPVDKGAAVFGLIDKYVAPRTVVSRQDDGRTLRVKLVEGGMLGVYLDRAPKTTRVDGALVSPKWKDGLLEVTLENENPKPHEVEIAR